MPKVKALLLASTALLSGSSGCTSGGMRLRPDGSPGPQECPEEAKKAMRYLNLHVGESASIYVDASQPKNWNLILHDGPIESALREELGPLAKASLLHGQVWTTGPQVVIRYYEVQAPNGEKSPLCAVARLGDDEMRRPPESKPGTAIFGAPGAAVFIVDTFR